MDPCIAQSLNPCNRFCSPVQAIHAEQLDAFFGNVIQWKSTRNTPGCSFPSALTPYSSASCRQQVFVRRFFRRRLVFLSFDQSSFFVSSTSPIRFIKQCKCPRFYIIVSTFNYVPSCVNFLSKGREGQSPFFGALFFSEGFYLAISWVCCCIRPRPFGARRTTEGAVDAAAE